MGRRRCSCHANQETLCKLPLNHIWKHSDIFAGFFFLAVDDISAQGAEISWQGFWRWRILKDRGREVRKKMQLLFKILYRFQFSCLEVSFAQQILTLPFMLRANLYNCKCFFHLHARNAGICKLFLGCWGATNKLTKSLFCLPLMNKEDMEIEVGGGVIRQAN